ncbi:PGF-pre-PGF domain-containing protein [Halobellus captivus]|uniref:PGF-pre-PGF domain-containing protein n=1 Tax=Halobellus captivus TaxID=2592614 RepID=UPI001396A273|nr:PGF-pre-PGF domain-containing protein [Halobellus captivus]
MTTQETAPPGVTDELDPDSVVVSVEITVPAAAEDLPARIRFRITTDELGERELDSLRVVRVVDGQNQELPTEVSEAPDGNYVIEADTPGFSTFAVVSVNDNTAPSGGTASPTTQTPTPSSPQISEATPSNEPDTETRTESSSGVPGFGPVITTLAIIVAGLVAHSREI